MCYFCPEVVVQRCLALLLVFLPQWPHYTSVVKLQVKRRPFQELPQVLFPVWQKEIIFLGMRVGITGQVSVCPWAVAHPSAPGILMLLDVRRDSLHQ